MPELRNDSELTEAQLREVQGGMLLPAVQKVREAAATSSSPPPTGTVTFFVDGLN